MIFLVYVAGDGAILGRCLVMMVVMVDEVERGGSARGGSDCGCG